jgi:hypothetical protein
VLRSAPALVCTEYSTYLPAFFVAGALCLFAAVLVLTLKNLLHRALAWRCPRLPTDNSLRCDRLSAVSSGFLWPKAITQSSVTSQTIAVEHISISAFRDDGLLQKSAGTSKARSLSSIHASSDEKIE